MFLKRRQESISEKMLTKYKYLLLLLALFFISILIRWDVLQNQPLGKIFYNSEYKYNTAAEVAIHNLFAFKTYEKYAIKDHAFASVVGHGGGIENKNTKDKDFDFYASFSPFFFYVPYLIAKIINIVPGVRFLQVFSLFIHLACIILVYLLITELLKEDKNNKLIALIGASVYTFSTNTLHFHMNVYWAHQLLQPVYILTLYLLVKHNYKLKNILLFVLCFFMSYIVWTGFFINISIGLFYLFSYLRKRDKDYIKSLLAVVGASLLSLLAIVIHFVLIANFGDYINLIMERVHARSGIANNYVVCRQYGMLMCNFFGHVYIFLRSLFVDYGFYLLSIFVLITLIIKTGGIKVLKDIFKEFKSYNYGILLISLFPLLESLILLEHDIFYSFGRLKFIIPIILIISLLSSYLLSQRKQIQSTKLFLILLFIVAHSIHVHFYQDIHGNNVLFNDALGNNHYTYELYWDPGNFGQLEDELKYFWNKKQTSESA